MRSYFVTFVAGVLLCALRPHGGALADLDPLQVVGGQLPGEMGKLGQSTPLGRAGQPVELAPLYVMLASDETSFKTGIAVGANGGKGSP